MNFDVLELRNLCKSYRRTKIFANINLEVGQGKSLAVTGPSGCGKSTLLKVISQITPPSEGSVILDGVSLSTGKSDRLSSWNLVSYSFQEPLLLPYLTGIENIVSILQVPIGLRGSLKARCVEMLKRLGLSERMTNYPSALSVGEKKRFDFARALLRNSKLMVADEPLSNLDPDSSDIVVKLAREYTENGGIFVFSSVNPSDSKIADITMQMGTSSRVAIELI